MGGGVHPGRTGIPGKSDRPDLRGGGLPAVKEGAAAEAAAKEAGRRTVSRRDLQRQHPGLEQICPESGELDPDALDEALEADPDETLSMLADLTSATDPRLRELARRLAGRVCVDLARRGAPRRRGIGRLAERPFLDGGDLDVDASMDGLVGARVHGGAVDPAALRARGWSQPGTALCLVVDRSGSMGGQRLATAAVAAAAVAWRAPADYSVVVFSNEVIVPKSQDAHRAPEAVVDDLFSLRGKGTTDIVAALRAAGQQLARSRAARKIAVLLSDGRHNVPGDVGEAARLVDELVVLAPADDPDDARALAERLGARFATIGGPSEVPEALAALLE